jgi:hypothetical protein
VLLQRQRGEEESHSGAAREHDSETGGDEDHRRQEGALFLPSEISYLCYLQSE